MGELEVAAHAEEAVELPLDPAEVEAVVRHVLRQEKVEAAEISLALVSDTEIARLNEEYLDHEGPTDVISFPLHAPGDRPLGDVYIGVEQARRQAEEVGVEAAEELLRLAVHGTLHVLGYEHPDGPDREGSEMYRRQEELLRSYLAGDRPAGR